MDRIKDDEEVRDDDDAISETNAKGYGSAKVDFQCLDG